MEAFYSTDEDGFFVTVFEKVGTINNKGQFTGTNYLRSRQGDIIAEKFRNNQLIGSAIKDNLSSPGGRQEPPNPCYACINHNYQQINLNVKLIWYVILPVLLLHALRYGRLLPLLPAQVVAVRVTLVILLL
ncbi:hypothetical protein [Siphonobacter sp. BAB-5385]|uniref:hypothetical protein n=1 Tax=Siphonobacter sp. BAB-5385 TaxID=1864822 RepID=UPI001140828B|nr:hypothetical protein [Siphonobacter sp. BAB-5385]